MIGIPVTDWRFCPLCGHVWHTINACVTCNCDWFAGKPGPQKIESQNDVGFRDLIADGGLPEAQHAAALCDIEHGRIVVCTCPVITGGHRVQNPSCPTHGKPQNML